MPPPDEEMEILEGVEASFVGDELFIDDIELESGVVDTFVEAPVESVVEAVPIREYVAPLEYIQQFGSSGGLFSRRYSPSFYNQNDVVYCSYCRNITDVSDIKEISGLSLCPDCTSKYKLPCHNCGRKVRYRNKNNFVFLNGVFCCLNCTKACEDCGSMSPASLLHEVNNKNYCHNCYTRRFFRCPDCGGSFPRDEACELSSGYTVCEDCYSENYFTCSECDEVHPNTSFARDEMCVRCARVSGHVHGCDFKPPPIFYGKGLMMGIELEVDKKRGGMDIFGCAKEVHSMSSNENHFYMKEDGSLNNGFEIVSHPMSLDFHKKFNWKKVFMTCVSHGFNSHNTSTCGMHVHISRNYLSTLDCVRLGMFVAFYKDKFEILSRREENYDYAKFKHVGKGSFKHAGSSDDGRYEAINWTNMSTIEFRLFKGTLLHETFFATLELVHAVTHFVKTVNTNQIYGVKDCFNSSGRKERKAWGLFCNFINNDKKTYKILINYMKEKGVFKCV